MRRQRLYNGYGEFTEHGKKAVEFLEKGIGKLLDHRMFKNSDLPDLEAIVGEMARWWSCGIASKARGKLWLKKSQRERKRRRK